MVTCDHLSNITRLLPHVALNKGPTSYAEGAQNKQALSTKVDEVN
jgi:hypothetical protein